VPDRDEEETAEPKPNGHAEVEERPREIDAPGRVADVPAVAPTVAVQVPELVRLPCVRREDDGDARERSQALDDERRVANAPVGSAESEEVEPARPVAGADYPQQAGSVSVASPVDADRARHRGAQGLEVTSPF